jgi:hypothetical protein
MIAMERRDLTEGEDREADEFADDLKALLDKYGFGLVMIAVNRPDGNLLAIENKKHVKRVTMYEGEIH